MNKFRILTPLNFYVRTSEEYWQKLIVKHPDLINLESEIRQTFADPDEIRRSSRDVDVLLFYRILKERRWAVAVVKRLDEEGFLITAYQTDALKEGDPLWHK